MISSLKENPTFANLAALVLLLLALFLGFKTWQTAREAIQVGKAPATEHTLSVEGIGIATIKPDVAGVSFSVETKGKDLPETQSKNATTMNALIASMKELGMEEKDIQTSSYNSYEDKVYNPRTNTYTSNGWVVTQQVNLTIRNTEKVSPILSKLGTLGATNISGPNWRVENDASTVDVAREKAITDAHARAEKMAKQLGVKLGRIVAYSEGQNNSQPMPYAMKSDMMNASAPAAPEIEAGENTVKLQVNITYVIE
ncbi:MAG: SIMPL domain-containing protein [Patescibacteria group bacterium]